MRLANKTFTNDRGAWIRIVNTWANWVSYNASGVVQSSEGRMMCSRDKMKTMLNQGQFTSSNSEHRQP